MHSAMYLGLLALLFANACCMEPRLRGRRPLIGKRGVSDYPAGYSPHHHLNFAPANGNLLANSHSSQMNHGYNTGYLLPQSQQGSNLGQGFNLASGLGHGGSFMHLLPASYHGGAYSMNLGSGGALLVPSPTKTGPVTFDNSNPGTASPYYVTNAGQDSPKQGAGGLPIQILLQALSSSQKAASGPQSSGYSTPISNSASGPQMGYAVSMASHAPGSGFIIPTSSHGSAVYSVPVAAPSYDSSQSHSGYSQPGSGKYVPASSAGSAYAIASSPKYSMTSASYGKAGYAVSVPSASYSSPVVNYGNALGSYSNQATSYSGPSDQETQSYDGSNSAYSSSSNQQLKAYLNQATASNAPSESAESYANQVPQYFTRYSSEKSPESYASAGPKYDTISYSSVNGKY